MKKTLSRSLSLLLAVVLAVSLALPAAAADPITLDRTEATIAPKDSITLTATLSSEYANKSITWKSSNPTVAEVSNTNSKKQTATITAKAEGYASITATVTDSANSQQIALCKVTVAKSKVTSLTLDPAGPEVLPIGKTRTLTAKANYSNGTTGTVDVTWSSTNTAVAAVSKKGEVTAVAEGTATIMALYQDSSNDSAVSATYQVTVSKTATTSKDDVLALSATTVNTNAGLFVESAVKAPAVTVKNGTTDVTEAYNITYLWTDASKKELGKDATLLLQPTTQADLLLTCTVTAASKTDSTQILTGTCTYGVKVYPSTSLGGVHSVAEGAVTLNKLMDLENKVSVIDQLIKGDDTGMAQPIAGLTHVVFDTNTITGSDVGTLSAKNGSEYYASTTADGDHLADVTFTPLKKGTFAINFLAYGDKVYYGRLEVLVDDAAVTPPTADNDVRQCDSTGFTFAGSDFYRDSDTDPVAAVVFGKPSAGHLLRNLSHGIGTADDGDKYYTNSASQGDYHVSTLSYLPDAGYMGQATIPVTYITAAGIETTGVIKVSVSTKTDSAQFKDVTRSNVGTWAADAVDFAYHFGLVSGVSKTEFAPNSPMTRAQLVTVLYRAAGSPSVTVSTNFEDLDVGSYYYSAVVWANVNGIVNGTSDTTFSPDSRLTRQQLAAILYRYARAFGGDTSYTGNLSHFTDRHQVDSYATTPMIWAVSHEIISGTSDTTLSPLSTATRAQVVVILHRYLTDRVTFSQRNPEKSQKTTKNRPKPPRTPRRFCCASA